MRLADPSSEKAKKVVRKRVLIASEFNARDRAHFALNAEFCRIIMECDDADLAAPGISQYLERYLGSFLPAHDDHNVQRDFNRLVNGVRKSIGLRNAATVERVNLEADYDLFFFIAWSPQSLVELSRIPEWRSRSKVRVLYMFELWTSTLEQDRKYLELLDQFDHVFMLHSACLPLLSRYTKTPCSFLPTGVDGEICAPHPIRPGRAIDVYSIGNRAENVHDQLVALSQEQNFFYVYDSLSSTDSRVKNWREHRLLLANMIKRTRYFIAFNPASLANPKASKIAGEQVLPSRLFEGAAGGAVMIGSAPQCPEFEEYFDWPDAVIDLDPNERDVAGFLHDLDEQTERIRSVRQNNIINTLRRHDWAHRWEGILNSIGMEPLPQLEQRKSRLGDLASAVGAPSSVYESEAV